MSETKIFMTGATGYIGGTILAHLLQRPPTPLAISLLTRSTEKASLISSCIPQDQGGKLKISPVLGSHSDLDLLEREASKVDVVLACADADDLEAARAILRGLKKQHEQSGKVPILIHTSGTGVLTDNAKGMYKGETVYDDTDVAQIESLPDTQLHRNVDLEIVAADKAGYAKTYIVLPSTIYGIATHALATGGFANPHSIQLPGLIRAGLDRGQGGVVGEGKNVWPCVHIDDVAEIYVLLLHALLAPTPGSQPPGHGREGFYFGESDEYLLHDAASRIAQALHKRGLSRSPEPESFTADELDKYFGGAYGGTNSRCRANRARKQLGWSPKHATKDMLDSLDDEVDALLKTDKGAIRQERTALKFE